MCVSQVAIEKGYKDREWKRKRWQQRGKWESNQLAGPEQLLAQLGHPIADSMRNC